MDWCVKDYANANHNPVVHLNEDTSTDVLEVTVKPEQRIKLSASGSRDPDGDRISYRWWQYQEADSYEGIVRINKSTSKNASYTAPKVDSSRTIHIILEVTDNGNPNLTSYRRLIATVDPSCKQ
jgi:hypothetical protein